MPDNNTTVPQKDFLLIETIIKLAALNKILVKKGLMTDIELQAEMTEISKNLTEQLTSLMSDFVAQSKTN